MTDEMVWALREKVAKGMTIDEMSETYGITTRIIAAAVGEEDDRDRYRNWTSADLWTMREMMCEGYGIDRMAEVMDTDRDVIVQVILKNADLYMPFDRRG